MSMMNLAHPIVGPLFLEYANGGFVRKLLLMGRDIQGKKEGSSIGESEFGVPVWG